MSRFFLLFLLLSFQSVLKALETASEIYTQEVKKGERNLLDITKKAEIYGECWHDALQSLNMECRHLNSELQSKLALKFTNCFLLDSGKPVCPCGPGESISTCLGLCSDIIFNTYTHFYTYTHSMCFFIKHKIFESEIAKSTLYLNTLAQKLNRQLDIIIENNTQHQNILLDHLNKSVNEIKLLDAEITRSREQTNQLFTDFKKVTANNTNLILKLYSKINDVKIFFIRELDFIYSVIFYLGLFIFLYFISSHKYLEKSRFILIFLTIVFFVIEYYLNYFCLKMFFDTENRVYYIWKMRQFYVLVCLGVIIRSYLSYLDFPKENNKLLLAMASDMAEIKLLLKKTGSASSGQHGGNLPLSMESAPPSNNKTSPDPVVSDLMSKVHYGNSHSAPGNTGALLNIPGPSSLSSVGNQDQRLLTSADKNDFTWLAQLKYKLRDTGILSHSDASKSEVSVRPDGSIRPLVRVKEGYTPPDFVADEDLVNCVVPVKQQQKNLEKMLEEIKGLQMLKRNGFILNPEQDSKINSLEHIQNEYNIILGKMSFTK